MRILGYDFECIDDEFLNELYSLEREGAIYTDHWIDALEDFRHVRIRLTPEEVAEYARSLWAYELYARAGYPHTASEVREIPRDIAVRADSYVLHDENGPVLTESICVAAFLGDHLEDLVCFNTDRREVLAERLEILDEKGSQALVTTVKKAIDSLTPAIRLFKNREKGLAQWDISREDDVRDLLYVMLRSSISDIRTEEPIPKRAGTHKYVDICSNVARLLVEVKWIGKKGSWKRIIDEVLIDIQSYITHPACETLVFVIMDAIKDIPDPALIEQELSGTQTIDGKEVQILVFIREP